MKPKLYRAVYRLVKSHALAVFCAEIGFFLFGIYYRVLRLFQLKKRSSLSLQEARTIVDAVCPIPEQNMPTPYPEGEEGLALSVIIPAYNVEKYVVSCLESVLGQKTSYSFEVIVIDDGSTDSTLQLLEPYRQHPRISILSQENQGLSARNTGIDHARGKFLMFVDSDDLLPEGAMECLLQAAEEQQSWVVQGAYTTFSESGERYLVPLSPQVVENPDGQQKLDVPGYLWGKIIRRELFRNVRYPKGFWFQDTLIKYIILPSCPKYVAIPDVVYHYRTNTQGITAKSRTRPKALEGCLIVEQMLLLRERLSLPPSEALYRLTREHLGNLMYRRICHLEDHLQECAFVIACSLMESLQGFRPVKEAHLMERDLSRAFEEKNYVLWKLVSKSYVPDHAVVKKIPYLAERSIK